MTRFPNGAGVHRVPPLSTRRDLSWLRGHSASRLKTQPDIIRFVGGRRFVASRCESYARNNHVDHIALAARGSSTLRRYLGSTSSQVMARALHRHRGPAVSAWVHKSLK
jgi:hypothetical protein